MLRIFREMVANTHEMPTKHSVRRRGPIHRARILALSNIHIRFTKYTFPFHHTRIFTLSNMRFRSPFRGCLYIRGHDKSAPTAADGLPITLLTDCNNVANIPRNAQPTLRKIYTFNHETPTNHSARRRGRFIAPVSLYYQI